MMKTDLVRKLYTTISETPSHITSAHANDDDKVKVANRVADAFIRSTDDFLKKHPGANYSQGTRNFIADAMGWQDIDNHPWCDDWATELLNNSELSTLLNQDQLVRSVVSMKRGQWHGQLIGQHNWVVIYATRLNVEAMTPDDPNLLFFDPWYRLRPEAYYPREHSKHPLMNFNIK